MSSFAIPQRTPTTWRVRAKRSRKKRRHADPTVIAAIRGDLPSDDKVKAYLAEFVRANRRLGIGLFTAKILDSKRPPKSLSDRVRDEFGAVVTDEELLTAASDAEFTLRHGLREHFGVSPNWHWRWLPHITT